MLTIVHITAKGLFPFTDERLKRIGQYDLLSESLRSQTLPVSEWEIVVGKYLASLGIFTALLVLTLEFPRTLTYVGDPDVGAIWAGYIGLFMVGATFLAIGSARRPSSFMNHG